MLAGRISRDENLREMLLSAGIGEMRATMAIPYMYFMPRSSDPYTQGVMTIVEGLQRMLRDRGAPLALDGGLGTQTAQYLAAIVPDWGEHTWASLYGAVMASQRRFATAPPLAGIGLGTSATGDLLASPMSWLLGGAALYWFFLRDPNDGRARAQRISGGARRVGRSARAAWHGARKEWR